MTEASQPPRVSKDPAQADSAPAKTRAARGEKGEEHLKSLVKLVKVLECFSTADRMLTVADICGRTGFPRSTTHRLLASLREVGFLDQDRERDRYRLGLKLFELGNTALANFDLNREAGPYVNALRRISGQSVHLAIFDGTRAVVINRADLTAETGGLSSNFIENAPVHCTSVGKAILSWQSDEVVDRIIERGLQRFTDTTICDGAALRAELAQIRARGYSIDEAEHQPGLRCIGAPIRNQNGVVFAGISISGSTWNLPAENVPELSKVVIHHADQISRSLGYSPT